MSINTPLNKIPFMNGLSIKIKDIPKYPAFDGKFTEKVDFTLCSMLLEKTNIFSPETISGFNTSVMSKMRNNGNLDVIHNQRFGLGRFYADNNTSLIPQPRAIKHTLFSYCGWLDLDMVKGHGSIALEVFKGILDLPSIRKYVDSFDDIVTVMSSFYKVEGTPLNKDNIKQLFNMMIYGGTPDGWIFKMSQDNEKRALGSDGQKGFKISYTTHHPFVLEFEKECMTMSNMVFKTNTSIVYKIKPKNGSKYDLKDMKNKTISYWFQIIENHIVYIVYELLVTLGYITAGKCGIEYDGLNIPPNGKIINQPLLTNIINDFVLTKTGLNVTFKFKDYGESVLTDLIETRKNMIVATPIDDVIEAEIIDTRETSNEIFNEMVGDFEKTHIKIVSEGVYVRTSGDGFYIMSRQQLINAYEHKQCGSIPFINKWITCNDSINRKDTMGIYPDPSKCPETSFNLWRPFAMETHTKPYTKNIDGLNKILEHFNVMSDYNEESYKYLLGWVAHMIQYPAKKIPCLVLTCLQGGGKTTLILHLTEMMGQKKVWEVTDPKRDIFGDFNGRMLDTFLVNLSEVGFADCKNDLGKFKALITDSTININQKGIKQVTIDSHHHWIVTTNKENPFQITKDCRRFAMMRSSDSKRGDKSHFSEQYTLMKDINTMRTLYDFFKEYDLTTFDPTNIPQTEILLGLKEQSVSIVEDWLKEYTIENINNLNVVQIPSKQVFSLFKAWLINDGRKFDSKVSGFSMKLTNLRIKGCDKGALDKYANATKLFDFKLLKKYFNIGVVNGVVDDIVNDVVDDVVDVEEYIEECDEVYVEVDNVVKNIVVEEYDQQTPPPFGIPVKRKPKI